MIFKSVPLLLHCALVTFWIFSYLCSMYIWRKGKEFRDSYISFTSNVLCFLSNKIYYAFYCFFLFLTLPIFSSFDLICSVSPLVVWKIRIPFAFCQWSCVFINSVFNNIYSVIPPSLFRKSCFGFRFYFKKTALFVFRFLLTAYFCFYQCITILHLSEDSIYVLFYNSSCSPPHPTPASTVSCSWAIWADHLKSWLSLCPSCPPSCHSFSIKLQLRARLGHHNTYHSYSLCSLGSSSSRHPVPQFFSL